MASKVQINKNSIQIDNGKLVIRDVSFHEVEVNLEYQGRCETVALDELVDFYRFNKTRVR